MTPKGGGDTPKAGGSACSYCGITIVGNPWEVGAVPEGRFCTAACARYAVAEARGEGAGAAERGGPTGAPFFDEWFVFKYGQTSKHPLAEAVYETVRSVARDAWDNGLRAGAADRPADECCGAPLVCDADCKLTRPYSERAATAGGRPPVGQEWWCPWCGGRCENAPGLISHLEHTHAYKPLGPPTLEDVVFDRLYEGLTEDETTEDTRESLEAIGIDTKRLVANARELIERAAGQSGDRPPVGQPLAPLGLALLFHSEYEALAPQFGYETRTETRAFDAGSPNGRLMVAVCASIIGKLGLAATAGDRPAPSPAAVDLARHMLDNRAMWERSPTTRVKSSELLAIAEALAGAASPGAPLDQASPYEAFMSTYDPNTRTFAPGEAGTPKQGAPDPLDALLDLWREAMIQGDEDGNDTRAAIHAHVADLTAERDEIAGLHRAVARLANERADEVLDLRATNAKLNRRAQEAESRVAKLERQIKTSPVTNLRKNMPLVKEVADLRARAERAEQERAEARAMFRRVDGKIRAIRNTLAPEICGGTDFWDAHTLDEVVAENQRLRRETEQAMLTIVRERAERAEAERDGLAAEVRAWRAVDDRPDDYELPERPEDDLCWKRYHARRANEARGWPSTPEERP